MKSKEQLTTEQIASALIRGEDYWAESSRAFTASMIQFSEAQHPSAPSKEANELQGRR